MLCLQKTSSASSFQECLLSNACASQNSPQRNPFETVITAHIVLAQFCFEGNCSLSLPPSYPPSPSLHPFNSFHHDTLPLSFLLSGTFADRVQLPDDNGASAEREPQRDRRRPLHTSWLSAAVEGLCAHVKQVNCVCERSNEPTYSIQQLSIEELRTSRTHSFKLTSKAKNTFTSVVCTFPDWAGDKCSMLIEILCVKRNQISNANVH